MNENKQTTTPPINDEKNKIGEHVTKHYRKYLFWIWTLSGVIISISVRILFGNIETSTKTNAAFDLLAPEMNAIIAFNQMDTIAHQKDNYFHQKGKIYTLSGETLFHKYDTMFHVLDNEYHRATDTQKKLMWAQKLETFFIMQNDLFASTEYMQSEQDIAFEQADKDFNTILTEIQGKLTGENLISTGMNPIFATGTNKILTGINSIITGKNNR